MTANQPATSRGPDVVLTQRQWLGPVGWLSILGFVASVAIAYGAAAGTRAGWWVAITGGVATPLVALLVSTRVAVTLAPEPTLHVGRAHIPLHLCGPARALDPQALAALRRDTRSAHAYWAAPGWCTQAVAFAVEDKTDPHEFWVVGSRNPTVLARTMNQLRSADATHGTMTA